MPRLFKSSSSNPSRACMTLHLLEFDQLHFIDFYYVQDSNKALKPKSGLSYGDSKYLVCFSFYKYWISGVLSLTPSQHLERKLCENF